LKVLATAMLFMVLFPLGQAGWAAFGTEYRQLVSVTGATNTGTSVSISTSGAANYIIDPYTTNSGLTGTPSSSVPSGYGWRTTGFQGQVIPAGTWSFAVQTNTAGVTLGTGTAFVRVYVYHTDVLGQDVQLIGTATDNQDILTLLGGTLNHNLSFSASGVNLTNRVLVVEYWVIVTQPPLLGATAAFHTVSDVASVQPPTSPAITYYLSTPRLHSMGLDEAIGTADTTTRSYSAPSAIQESVTVTDSTRIQVTRSIDDGVGIAEALSTGLSRPWADSIVVMDTIVAKVTGKMVFDELAVIDSISAKVTGRAISEQLNIMDDISAAVGNHAADEIQLEDSIKLSVSRSAGDSVAWSDSITIGISRAISDELSMTDEIMVGREDSISDDLTLDDVILTTVTRSIFDVLGATESASLSGVNLSHQRSIFDTVVLTDSITVAGSQPSASASVPRPSGGGGTRVDITTYAGSYFEENPLERIKIIETAFFVERTGRHVPVTEFNAKEDLVISTVFKSYQRVEQPYLYVVQILDKDGYTVHFETSAGSMRAGQTTNESIIWEASSLRGPSPYYIIVFVWTPAEIPESLSRPNVGEVEVMNISRASVKMK
jgi:hypothetical protein